MYCMQCFLKSKYIKSRTFNDKNCWIIKKLWSLRSCLLILPPGALTPQGIEGAIKRDVSKHWCTLQWCASRGWVIAYSNWTSWGKTCLDFRPYHLWQQHSKTSAYAHSLFIKENGPLARYAKLRVAHASGMPGTFSPPPWVSVPDMHHSMCMMHLLWCKPGSLISGFLWLVGCGENIPRFPGACPTRTYTYLVRGPCLGWMSPDETPEKSLVCKWVINNYVHI